MIILPKSGLVATVKKVRDYLAENGVDAEVYFGWKPSARTTLFPRVCIVPSDPDTGDSGPITLNINPGDLDITDKVDGEDVVVGRVRILREWERIFHVQIWAAGSNVSEEDLVEESETLLEWIVRAFQFTSGGQVAWGSPKWTVAPAENTNGRALLMPAVLMTPLFDKPAELVRPSAAVEGEFKPPTPPA